MRSCLRQKIQYPCRKTKPGKEIAVGKPPAVEAKNKTVPDRIDSALQNHEVYCPRHCEGTCAPARLARRVARGCGNTTVNILVFFIRIYQKTLSPLLPECCRFEPTCSKYAVGALQKHGFWKGLILTVWRLARCQPFCKGGFDPVPEDFHLRRTAPDKLNTDNNKDEIR